MKVLLSKVLCTKESNQTAHTCPCLPRRKAHCVHWYLLTCKWAQDCSLILYPHWKILPICIRSKSAEHMSWDPDACQAVLTRGSKWQKWMKTQGMPALQRSCLCLSGFPRSWAILYNTSHMAKHCIKINYLLLCLPYRWRTFQLIITWADTSLSFLMC